jgi:ATP-binding cassette, subfamily B, heavy metal transporter
MSVRGFNPEAIDSNENHLGTIKTLLPYLWLPGRPDLKIRVVGAMLLLLAAKLVTVFIVPYAYKFAVDSLVPAKGGLVVIPLLMIVAYGLGRATVDAFQNLRDAIFVSVGQNALRSVATEVFIYLHKLALPFHVERRTGGLSRVIERGVKSTEFLLRFSLFNVIPTLIEICLVTAVMLINFDWRFAAATLVSVGLYIFFTFTITEWRLKFRREMNKQDTEANTKAVDSLLNYETVKYFSNEEHEARRYDAAMQRYMRAAINSQSSLALLNIGQALIIATGLIVVLLMAANGFRDGRYTIGDFTMANVLLLQLFGPLGFLGFVYREIKQALVDMDKMFTMLQIDAEIKDSPGAKPLMIQGGVVEFSHVDFSYNPNRQILFDVTFQIPAGKTVAVVGPSGAGKSTLSRLLFRFYDIQSGSIKVDGQDIRQVTQKSLRSAVGIVPQDTVLFNDTILYNIRYGRPTASDEEVRRAAKLAHIHSFVERLPEGYQTMVGERGLKLSGGEKQRVAIARTILKDPPILLLDEATSSLDSATEKDIQRSVEEVSENRTTLIIAHRLSTIIHAHQILVIEGGRIVERGTHRELVELGGLYADMWARQQEATVALATLAVLEESGKL